MSERVHDDWEWLAMVCSACGELHEGRGCPEMDGLTSEDGVRVVPAERAEKAEAERGDLILAGRLVEAKLEDALRERDELADALQTMLDAGEWNEYVEGCVAVLARVKGGKA